MKSSAFLSFCGEMSEYLDEGFNEWKIKQLSISNFKIPMLNCNCPNTTIICRILISLYWEEKNLKRI